ncbi:zinc finger protein 420-like [Chelmon rostratus]|uniref:zinc finger protein 420-like n=1 Tax=Chelmon rostratus TaxID=109905 RepID=UPI001BE5CDA3|nr:zinc finger protein 420-like [Chelmon rostratus]
MSSVEYLREFVSERLTAAAEEIFRVFKETIVEYEEEIRRQRKLLDVVWKPEIKIHRTELPQQRVSEEEKEEEEEEEEKEVLPEQQLCDQQRNSSLDLKPPRIKEEQEELCTSQEGEQLVLKQETDTFMWTPTYEESDHLEPEPRSDHQLLCNNGHVAQNQDQKGDEDGDSQSAGVAEKSQSESHSDKVHYPDMSHTDHNARTGKRTFRCDTCGKDFNQKQTLQRHRRLHTGEKPYSCKTCGKDFRHDSVLKGHMRTHTGERPYLCKTCGRAFRQNGNLTVHMRRVHSGEKPFVCKTCWRRYVDLPALRTHMRRVHAGEKPHLHKTCEKKFTDVLTVKSHETVHCFPQV